uniref:Dopamine receptor D3 n=1 Tax=Neogobius melanostomus TaxID=47308 RepID=A0A8C6T7R7_9GOBI
IKMLETIEGHIGTTCGNESVATARPDKDGEMNYYAMFYSLLILAIVFGNVLVCLAVLRERSLQTTTNYLVVSLAVADLLVASLVMPWAVYLEVHRSGHAGPVQHHAPLQDESARDDHHSLGTGLRCVLSSAVWLQHHRSERGDNPIT